MAQIPLSLKLENPIFRVIQVEFFSVFRYYNHDSPGDEHTRRRVVCAAVTVSNIDSTKCDELMGEE